MPEPGMTTKKGCGSRHGEANNQTLQSRDYLSERFVSEDGYSVARNGRFSKWKQSRKHVEEMRENIHSVLEDMTGGENSQVLIGDLQFTVQITSGLSVMHYHMQYSIHFREQQ